MDGNCVTKVKYAGTLVAHWTKPLLRQHRCPEELSGPYGRYRETRGGGLEQYHLLSFNAVPGVSRVLDAPQIPFIFGGAGFVGK